MRSRPGGGYGPEASGKVGLGGETVDRGERDTRFTIGIMPLQDSEWTRGKCAFKMLQYMAAGVPVVASDVGMNAALLRQADVGIGVSAGEDWAAALQQLMQHGVVRRRLGENGRALAVSDYSLHRVAALWKEQIDKAL